ncbi:DnaT-like ssDNA-binding domain-containing protein [Pseudomonas paralcaligenes]|uniref:DnaT-like ssDNA-binding domain-containing protein n=1 Tax=Pseudomonas paralcaligenes TaxID=2772558 RepID=UPI001C7F7A87|nr:DnaT-like ssDNA-binding domain-containing protein [Pseudomonas paralcaligenes]
MAAFQINDAEWSALVEEPGDIFLAYCAIRRLMDYSTGVAGQARRISEQMLREVLYVAPCRGRHESGSPTRQRTRSVVERLITLGALEQIGPMVYRLPLATRDGAPKRSATNEQPHQKPNQQPELDSLKARNDAAPSVEDAGSATASASLENGISNLPPVSGLPTPPPAPIGGRFPMRDDWEPTQRGWKATCSRNAVTQPLTEEDLREFRSYWINRPEKYQSQGQWEHELAQRLITKVRYAESNRQRSQGRRDSGQGSLEAELLDTSWAERLVIPDD